MDVLWKNNLFSAWAMFLIINVATEFCALRQLHHEQNIEILTLGKTQEEDELVAKDGGEYCRLWGDKWSVITWLPSRVTGILSSPDEKIFLYPLFIIHCLVMCHGLALFLIFCVLLGWMSWWVEWCCPMSHQDANHVIQNLTIIKLFPSLPPLF